MLGQIALWWCYVTGGARDQLSKAIEQAEKMNRPGTTKIGDFGR